MEKVQIEKVEKFLANIRMPKPIKQTRRLIGFVQYFQKFIPNLAIKLQPFFIILRKESEFLITDEHKTSLSTLKNDLAKACELSLKMAKPNCQFVIVSDASFYAAGFILLIEDYHEQSKNADEKSYAPVAFGSHLFSPAELKFSIYVKEFLSIKLTFESFEHYIWGASNKPVIVLSDNKSVTRFFQTKILPGNLWNTVDYVLSFSFTLGHIPGKANAAADYLSRIHVNPATKMKLKITDRIPMKNISIDVTPCIPDNSLSTLTVTELQQIPLISIEETDSEMAMTINSFTNFSEKSINVMSHENPLDNFDVSDKLKPLKIEDEQKKDSDIVEAMRWIRNKVKPCTTYSSFDLQKYHKQLRRLLIENNTLYRKFFHHHGKNFIKQLVVPKHLLEELLYRIHNSKLKGHIGITKTILEFRKKYYFPGFNEFLIVYINNCLSCLQAKSPKHETLTPPLNPVSSNTSFPCDLLQVDIVGQLPKSGGYSYIITAMGVFSKYMFAQAVTSPSAEVIAKILMQWFLRHSYIPLAILKDKGSAFTSQLLSELAKMLEIKINHATLKHAQTIELLERSHGPLKRYLRIYENQVKHDWHKFVDFSSTTLVFIQF